MKVLFVTPYLSRIYGGTTVVFTQLAKVLGANGINVDIVTTDAAGEEKQKNPLNTWISQDGYRVKYFPSWHRRDFIVSLSFVSWLAGNISEYDVVHIHTIFAPIPSAAAFMCRLKSIPYIITPHGMLESWALRHKAFKKKVYFTLFEKLNLHRASGIQALSANEAESINAVVRNPNVFIVPNGVTKEDVDSRKDAELFLQHFPHLKDMKIILFLGRIDPKKGFDLLAAALAQVKLVFPDAHLVIGGADLRGYLDTARGFFKKADCLSSVTFTGLLEEEMKNSALSAADIFVMSSYSEGFSMAILEAMAAGLPCIITKGCGFPGGNKRRAAIIVDIDSSALAQGLLQCLSDPQEAGALGARARELILEEYTWENIAFKAIDMYNTILSKR